MGTHKRLIRLGLCVILPLTVIRIVFAVLYPGGTIATVDSHAVEELVIADYRFHSQYAFATFLGTSTQSDSPYDEDDPYFMGVRQLAYKLLHAGTAKHSNIPLLVLCTTAVSQSKRARLTADGAIIVPVQDIVSETLQTEEPRWRDMLTKLRLFELTGYDKVCYIDADVFVAGSLKGIFRDPATRLQPTIRDPSNERTDEALLPDSYMLAGHNDMTITDYMNAGFFVFTPSRAVFLYYMSLLDKSDRFDPPGYMEQGLLNYAHRLDGNMPWTELSGKWFARIHHDKYYRCETIGCPNGDYANGEKWMAQKAEMMRYWSEESVDEDRVLRKRLR